MASCPVHLGVKNRYLKKLCAGNLTNAKFEKNSIEVAEFL